MTVRQHTEIAPVIVALVATVLAGLVIVAESNSQFAHDQDRQTTSQPVEHQAPIATHPQPDDPAVIEAIQKLGGRVFIDRWGRVTKVIWHQCPVSDADMGLLKELHQLRTLNIRGASNVGPGITDAGLVHLASLTNLRVLELSANPGITDHGLESLNKLTSVTYLNLSQTRVTSNALSSLTKMNELRRLVLPRRVKLGDKNWGCAQASLPVLWGLPIEQLDGINFNQEGFRYVSGLTELRRLPPELSHPKDTELADLQEMTQLDSLGVHLQQGWSNTQRLKFLRKMRELTALSIGGKPANVQEFDSMGLAILSGLANLSYLRLGGISDVGMDHLPVLPQVRELDLSISHITGPGLAHLTKFPNLEALTLDPTTLTVEGLTHLPQLPGLQTLDLSGMPFQRDGISHVVPFAIHDRSLKDHLGDTALSCLERLPNLKTLSLYGLPITDAGLVHLQRVPRLESVGLGQTDITDAGFVHIRSLDNLRSFNIVGTDITYQAAELFSQLNPRCYIPDNNWCCGCLSFGPVPPVRNVTP